MTIHAAPAPPAASLRVTGPTELVYQWKTQRCTDEMLPDTAARAFRDRDGVAHLLAPNDLNWSMKGPSLTQLSVVCSPLATSTQDPNPAHFDDKAWIEATYTVDGVNVYAFASNEWSAFRHPGAVDTSGVDCSSTISQGCIYYAITEFVSHDGGAHFEYTRPRHLVAAAATPFHPTPGQSASTGAAIISNLISRNGGYYALIGMRRARPPSSGSCLVRAHDLADPSSWRGWDGAGFNVKFANPYYPTQRTGDAHPCAPVLDHEARSLMWAPRLGLYVAVFREWSNDDDGKRVPGFFYATSADLIHWSDLRLLLKIPTDKECRDVLVYPSLLDPQSESRNFETIGARPYLYFVRFNRTHCGGTSDRDLVRAPLALSLDR